MNINRQKALSVLIGLVIIILLIGFVFMSLILIDILKYIDLHSKNFIDFIREFFQEFQLFVY